MRDHPGALVHCLLVPLDVPQAPAQAAALGLLILQQALRSCGLNLEARQLVAQAADSLLVLPEHFPRRIPRFFELREFGPYPRLLPLRVGETRGAVRQPFAHRAALQCELEPLHGAQLLAHPVVAARLGGLAPEGVQLPGHLTDDVVDAQQILLRHLELHFGRVAPALEEGDARGLLDQGPAVGGLRTEDLADAPLLDQRVGVRPQSGPFEQRLDILQPTAPPVQVVLAFAGTVEPPTDREPFGIQIETFGNVEVVHQPESQDNFGETRGLARLRAVEDHTFHVVRAQALGALFTYDPADRIGDVALPAPVRADDSRHPLVEDNLGAVAEGFEANSSSF